MGTFETHIHVWQNFCESFLSNHTSDSELTYKLPNPWDFVLVKSLFRNDNGSQWCIPYPTSIAEFFFAMQYDHNKYIIITYILM